LASPPRIIAEQVFTKTDAAHTTVTHSFTGDDGTAPNRIAILLIGASPNTGSATRINTAISWGTTTFTRLRRLSGTSGGNQNVELYWAAAPDDGTHDFTLTWNFSVDVSYARFYIIENAEQIQPESATNQQTGTSSTVTLATVSADDLILALFAWKDGADPFSEPAGFVEDADLELTSSASDMGIHVIRQADASAGTNVAVTSTATASANGAGVVVSIGTAGGTLVTIGIATETDSALAIAGRKDVAVGQAIETDSALAISASRDVAIGLALETDAALAIVPVKDVLVGLAIDVDQALPIGAARDIPIGQALEISSALQVGVSRDLLLGLAVESNQALPVLGEKIVVVGIAIETDTAIGIALTPPEPSLFITGEKADQIGLIGEQSDLVGVSGAAGAAISISGSKN